MTVAGLLLAAAVAVALWPIAVGPARRSTVRARLRGVTAPRPVTAARLDPLAVLGAAAIRAAASVLGGGARGRARQPLDRTTARRVGVAVVALPGAVVSPALAGIAVLAAAAPALAARRRRTTSAAAAAVESLPDTVDLLVVVARAGLPVIPAITAVAERAPPPWDRALGSVVARTGRGELLVDALDELPATCGDAARPLRAVLRAATEDGADLPGGLDRVAADARDLRRRRAEEAARRIPVRLLLPLVACSLPAFALLSIVPILVGALRALDF